MPDSSSRAAAARAMGKRSVSSAATLHDTRPLAVRGRTEGREDRARFLDGTEEISGDGAPVEGVTELGGFCHEMLPDPFHAAEGQN
ncbi:MAG: hypothetical protein KA152_08980 [Verrucomicrobiales bacterium]|nr:hypothetical protein [Verrucomicrobiales bacterium]